MTRLLPSVFADLDSGRRLTVLDLSAATSESVRFFSRFQCRLYFADLLGVTGFEMRRRQPPKEGETVFDGLLGLPNDVVVDVCLFWDSLNCMDEELLSDLARTLVGHVHPDTRVHAYIAFANTMPFEGHRHFGLADVDQLTAKTTSKPTPYRHTRKVITRSMWPFSIRNAVLLSDNRQELFMMPEPEGIMSPRTPRRFGRSHRPS